MQILFLGDVVGKCGRTAIAKVLPELISRHNPRYVIANIENASDTGFGITLKELRELEAAGINIFTSGPHIWQDASLVSSLSILPNLLRPLNYPPGVPGYGVFDNGELAVINLVGRVFLVTVDCPFRVVNEQLPKLRAKIVIVDFHAETTSEKRAMGWYLNGKVSAVIGTHTHVQTRDAEILSEGTGYITDAGMVGAADSVIGFDKQLYIKYFLTGIPQKLKPATGTAIVQGVLLDIDDDTGKTVSITPLSQTVQ